MKRLRKLMASTKLELVQMESPWRETILMCTTTSTFNLLFFRSQIWKLNWLPLEIMVNWREIRNSRKRWKIERQNGRSKQLAPSKNMLQSTTTSSRESWASRRRLPMWSQENMNRRRTSRLNLLTQMRRIRVRRTLSPSAPRKHLLSIWTNLH